MQSLARLPLFVVLMGVSAVAMYVPAFQAYGVRDLHEARVFFYGANLFLILATMIGLATRGHRTKHQARGQLLSLLAAFTLLPVMLAIPFYEAVETTSFVNAYFEMVSSFTTTGATLFDNPDRLAPSVHLWRAIVAWLGGFLMWVTAIAILAPMNLGGFEVTSTEEAGRVVQRTGPFASRIDPAERLVRFTVDLLPIYGGLTAILCFVLIMAGDPGLIALCHAMSIMATSGISPIGGLDEAPSGRLGEMLMVLFFVFAISRLTFAPDIRSGRVAALRGDPELRFAAVFILAVPLFLFLRHWSGAYDVADQDNLAAGFQAFWGSIFTVVSFLTTTGFASADWGTARDWSGLPTPGLVLVGLALIGGGVATTSGGVKLLRVYALYKHGLREIDRLIHPSSVAGAGVEARQIRRQGAYIAWIFFMLFALSVALTMTALSLTGLQFETSMVLTVAALSSTGPLASVAAETPISYAGITDAAKMILAAAMVLGRLEALAIIALLNPDFWRS